MTRRILLTVLAACLLGAANVARAEISWMRLLQAGVSAAQAMTVSDKQIIEYTREFVEQSDKQNKVCAASSPYTMRLRKLTQGLDRVEDIPLNFKVYQTNDVNAFACADGSVRIYSGLMDVMTDEEVLGVIGHEMGHVAHKDVKNAFKQALYNTALMQAAGGLSSTVATLTDSQAGAIAQALASSRYSKKQENAADEYGYTFLKRKGKNPVAMVSALTRLKELEDRNGGGTNYINQLFSSHPDIKSRIKKVTEMARKDGYVDRNGKIITK